MGTALAELLEYLTPEEQREVDEHIVALTEGRPHVEYRDDVIGWAWDKLSIPEHTLRWSLNEGYRDHRWDGDVDPLVLLYQAVQDWKDGGVESGTGTGKSFGVAVLILWFLACWENALAFTFAPTEKQLKLYIWKNIGELFPRFHKHFPHAELTELTLRMRGGIDESWAAHGYAVGIRVDESVATRAAGMHAPDMLLVYEETPGIPQPVMEAGENTCTAPHNIRVAIGNPNNKLDPLHKFCLSPGVVHVRMSALDHPNVVTGNADLIPGAISRVSIDRRREKYGEASPVYQSRVRGVSPEQASDALIRYEWLVASDARFQARKLAGTLPTKVTGKGVDVANSEHGDRAAIADFYDNCLPAPRAFQCPDCNVLGRQVKLEMQGAELPPMRVGVDCIGVGAGTVNELRRLGSVVNAINAGAKPMQMVEKVPDHDGTIRSVEWSPDVNMFRTLGDQLWWQLREDLRTNVLDMERDDELWEELICPRYDDTSKVVVIESKDEQKERLGRSPDKAESVRLGNWVRKRVVVVEPPELPRGKSLGYDYRGQKPRERLTGEQEMEQMFERAQPRPLAGRYRLPR